MVDMAATISASGGVDSRVINLLRDGPPPPNDDWLAVDLPTDISVRGTFVGATVETDVDFQDPTFGGNAALYQSLYRSVWYRWIAPSSGGYDVRYDGDADNWALALGNAGLIQAFSYIGQVVIFAMTDIHDESTWSLAGGAALGSLIISDLENVVGGQTYGIMVVEPTMNWDALTGPSIDSSGLTQPVPGPGADDFTVKISKRLPGQVDLVPYVVSSVYGTVVHGSLQVGGKQMLAVDVEASSTVTADLGSGFSGRRR